MNPTVTTFTVVGLTPNTLQCVVVRALYPGFFTDSDSSASAYTLANAPTALSLSRPAGNTLTVTWNPNGNAPATRYQIHLTPPSGIPVTKITTDPGETLGSLDTGQPYAVTVRSLNENDIEATASRVISMTFSNNVREMAFGLTGGSTVTVRIQGPAVSPEPAIAVIPSESFPPPDNGLFPLSLGFRVSAAPGLSPSQSGTISLSWPTGQVAPPPEYSLVLARYDLDRKSWIPLATSVDFDSLTARMAGWGVFQVMAQQKTAAQALPPQAFPNPFRPSIEPLALQGFNPGTEIHILDVRGRALRTLRADAGGKATWDGADSGGAPLGTGVYAIRGDGDQQRLRVLLKR